MPRRKAWAYRRDSTGVLRRFGRRRGRYTLFLGWAPGIGKTHRMLESARAQAAAGRDVVAVSASTLHRRSGTAALADEFETYPPSSSPAEPREGRRVDLEGILKRRPDLCLIDELVGAKVIGRRKTRRFEVIEEILEAGIDIFSTANVYRFESQLRPIPGLKTFPKIRTVPDSHLAIVDEIVFVDADPETLIRGFRAGNFYDRDTIAARAGIGADLHHFYTPENLAALRDAAREFLYRWLGGAYSNRPEDTSRLRSTR